MRPETRADDAAALGPAAALSEAVGRHAGAANDSTCVRNRARRHIYRCMRPSPWKRRLVAAIRWSLLVDALVSASAALLTILPWPVWTPAMGGAWPVGFVVPEIALWLVPLPVCFAAAALWLGRRSPRPRRWLTGITVVLCAAAVMLFCKPAVQAWRLGRTLDATLDAAFGAPPVPPPCPAFSLAAAVMPRNPAPVAIETMQYADGLSLDFY